MEDENNKNENNLQEEVTTYFNSEEMPEGDVSSITDIESTPSILSDKENVEDNLENSENTKTENELITVRPVKFQDFNQISESKTPKKNLELLQDINLHVKVELGKTKASIRDIMDYEKESIVELDKIAGEQVEVYICDKLVAKGEVIVIEDNFGVKITSTDIKTH